MLRLLRYSSLPILIVLALAVLAPPAADANDDVYREGSQSASMFHKLGRGTVNLLTGWIEIPKNIAKRWRDYDPFTGFFVGGAEGCAWGLGRTATGAYDMVTFFLPIPEDYQPLMEPEFILPGLWGAAIPEMEPVSTLRPLR